MRQEDASLNMPFMNYGDLWSSIFKKTNTRLEQGFIFPEITQNRSDEQSLMYCRHRLQFNFSLLRGPLSHCLWKKKIRTSSGSAILKAFSCKS